MPRHNENVEKKNQPRTNNKAPQKNFVNTPKKGKPPVQARKRKSLNPESKYQHCVQYKIGPEAIARILSERKDDEKGIPAQEYLCNWVNSEMNLLGYCVEVV